MILRDDHLRVLRSLAQQTTPHGEWCVYFTHIENDTEMDRKTVRRCCRYLKKRDLAEFHRLFSDDDGMAKGSGYCVTVAGLEVLKERDEE